MNKLLQKLCVYKTDYTLENFGITKEKGGAYQNDGYYVIPIEPIKNINKCISIGVGTMIDFEEKLNEYKSNINFYFYDHTVDSLPVQKENFYFNKIGLGQININNLKNINTILYENDVQNNNILLKIDIEGAEYNSLPYLNDDLTKNIKIFILELHWLDEHYLDAINLLDNINKNFTLIHSHGISWCGKIKIDEEYIPNVIELTYINKNIDTNNLGNIFYRPELDKIKYE